MPRSASRPLSMDESVVQVPCRAADTALSRLLAGRPGHESSRWHPVCPGAPERRSKYPAMYSIQKIIDLLLLLGVPSLLFIGAYVLRRPKRELSWEPVLDQRVHCWKWCAYGFIFLLYVPGTTLYRTLIPTGCDGLVCVQFFTASGYRIAPSELHVVLVATAVFAGYFFARVRASYSPIPTRARGYVLKVAYHGKGEYSPHLEIARQVRRRQLRAELAERRRLEREGFHLWLRSVRPWVCTLARGSTVELLSPMLSGRDPLTLVRWLSRSGPIHDVVLLSRRLRWCEAFFSHLTVNHRLSFKSVRSEGIRFRVG